MITAFWHAHELGRDATYRIADALDLVNVHDVTVTSWTGSEGG